MHLLNSPGLFLLGLTFLITTCNKGLALADPSESRSHLSIVSDKPATKWDEGFPIGNGRLGMLTLGAWPVETMYLNENSIWAHQNVNHRKNSAEVMKSIRELAYAGLHHQADKAWIKGFLQPMWRPASYEFAGSVFLHHLNLDNPLSVDNILDLLTGISTSEATYENGKTLREAVALRNRDIIAMRISTTRPEGIHLRIAMYHPRDTIIRNGNQITIDGRAANGGTAYQSRLRIIPESDEFIKKRGNSLEVHGGKKLVLLFNVGTNYNHSNPDQPLESNWQEETAELLEISAKETWAALRNEASQEMLGYMDRFSINLGNSPSEAQKLTTAMRIKRYAAGKSDPDLEELLFQFGRYCVVASNRIGGLPSNLQGIWSEGLLSPWSADYHLNINLQMNYWPVEPTGLSELHQPMLDFISAMQPSGEAFAKSLGLDGSCMGHAVNAWMNTQFSGNSPGWSASLMNGAWVTAHMMEHFRYSADKKFLHEQAWPVIQNNARFILSWLQWDEMAKEWITGPGTSPENQFIYTQNGKKIKAAVSCGNTHDLMIAWESLSDLVEAAEIIEIENELVKHAKDVLKTLAEGRIGPDGRMQEWRQPFEEPMPGHRHVSHAYGFFPGRQYNIIEDPKQTKAIEESIDFRLANGGGHTSWSRAWLINIEACLRRSDSAYANIRKLISEMVNPNLFTLHPPFQIDGNFGYTSGVVTMLMQSHIVLDSGERVIWLLPALPTAWPTGEVKGLRSRGGLEINLRWNPDSVEANFHATSEGKYQIRYGEKITSLKIKAGEKISISLK